MQRPTSMAACRNLVGQTLNEVEAMGFSIAYDGAISATRCPGPMEAQLKRLRDAMARSLSDLT